MLKNIPAVLSPELLSIMMRMGHGDELVLADADFPAETCARRLVRLDGVGLPALLDAVLTLFPLDSFSQSKVAMMSAGGYDAPAAWDEYPKIIARHVPDFGAIESLDRFDFYERAKTAFAVVTTGEPDGNLILKKGTVNL